MAADTREDDESDMHISPNFKGPDKNFPFRYFRNLGLIHLALGISTQLMALIQLSLGPQHRDIFLQFAAAPLWCPIPVIAVGVLGICMSRKRYWEVRCMKVCFGVLALINAFLFMVIMGSLVGFYGYWYYSVSTYEPAEADDQLVMQESTGYTILVTLILIVAGLEVVVSICSFFICCCCAHVRRPKEGKTVPPTPDVHKSMKQNSTPVVSSSAAATDPSSTAVASPPQMLPNNQPAMFHIQLPNGQTIPVTASPISGDATAGLSSAGPSGMAALPTSPPLENFDKRNKSKKEKKAKKQKENKSVIHINRKKENNSEKQQPPPSFTVSVAENPYSLDPTAPMTHGHGVPAGFVSSPGSHLGIQPSAPSYISGSGGTYTSMPNILSSAPPAQNGLYPNLQQQDYYTSIPPY